MRALWYFLSLWLSLAFRGIQSSPAAPDIRSSFQYSASSPLTLPLTKRNIPNPPTLRNSRSESLNTNSVKSALDIGRFHHWTIPLTINNVTFDLLVDTGSSESWVIREDFRCNSTEDNAKELPQARCRFGKLYDLDIADEHPDVEGRTFMAEYGLEDEGKGEFAYGTFGREEIRFGDVVLRNATFAFAYGTAWTGDDRLSGIFGLGGRELTSAYLNNDGDQRVLYDPLWVVICKHLGLPAIFSISVERDGTGNLLLGESRQLEDSITLDLTETNTTYEVPLQYIEFIGHGSKRKQRLPLDNKVALIDSGTVELQLPSGIARKIINNFEPEPIFNDTLSAYTVNRSSEDYQQPESIRFNFESKIMELNPEDLLYDIEDSELKGLAIKVNDDDLILGAPFFLNVDVQVDTVKGKMHMAQK